MQDNAPFATIAVVLLACVLSVVLSVRWARSQTVADAKHEIEASFEVVRADLREDFEQTVSKANIDPTPDKVRYDGST